MTVSLSVLDLAPVPPGGTGADAFRNSVALARAAEAAGYARYWVAEHHLTPGVASASTPVLAGLIAGATLTIRVGSGAVQMPMTPPPRSPSSSAPSRPCTRAGSTSPRSLRHPQDPRDDQ